MRLDGPASARHDYRADIDGLRAVAVVSVVAFHAFPDVLPGGFTGVDIFFVISGFLITRLLLLEFADGRFGLIAFYERRVRRIVPALLVVLAATFASGWLLLLPDEFEQLGMHMASGALFVSNYVLRAEAGYFDAPAELKPLIHLWSLAIEEQFYVIWPLALVLLFKLGTPRLAARCLLLTAMLSLLICISRTATDPVAAFFETPVRAWELLGGATLAFREHRVEAMPLSERSRDALSVAGAALLVVAFFLIGKHKQFPGLWALVPVAGTLMLIAAGPHALVNRNLLSRPLLVAVGLISYSLYLWHWPILSFARIHAGEPLGVATRLVLTTASFALAWLTYRFIEQPARLPAMPVRVAFLLAGIFAVGAAGAMTYIEAGLGSRSILNRTSHTAALRDPIMRDEACTRYTGKTSDGLPYCRFADAGSGETLALIGDSHAQAAFTGIAELAIRERKNVVLLANSSCPPLVGVPIYSRSRKEQAACESRITEILGLVSAKQDIKQVIVFTRGSIYLNGTEPASGPADALHAEPVSAKAFKDGLQATIDVLRAAGKDVVYVTENPELPSPPSSCGPRPFREQSRCSLRRTDVLARQSEYLALVRELRGVQILWSVELFCPKERCNGLDGSNQSLYFDDDHLSTLGSQIQASWLLGRLGNSSNPASSSHYPGRLPSL